LRQLILAVHDYEMAHEHFPAGTVDEKGPIRNVPKGHHISWIARILPYLEENALFANLDLSLSAYHHKNDPARQTVADILICPSCPADYEPYSNYAGCHHDVEAPIDADNRGVFFLNSRVTRDDLKDGAAYILFIGEKLIDDNDLGWLSGTPATLRNTGAPLNARRGNSWPSGSLKWLYNYAKPENNNWTWSEDQDQIDPITGETLRLNPETGVYEPVDGNSVPADGETPLTNDAAAPADGGPPSTDISPPGNAGKPVKEPEKADVEAAAAEAIAAPADAASPAAPFDPDAPPPLKADANGLYPHSRLGGAPAKPLAVGGFSSRHADGVQFALGDGSVRFIAESASAGLMGRLANRADGQTIDAREW
jgi:hypothetical protein